MTTTTPAGAESTAPAAPAPVSEDRNLLTPLAEGGSCCGGSSCSTGL